MKKIIRIALLTILSFSLGSCYNYHNLRLLQDKSKLLPEYSKAEYKDYKIRVNDEIVYRLITSDETISKLISPQGTSNYSSQYVISYRVFPDGTIDIPFIDSVKVEGMTITEAAKAVETRFRTIIPDAEVRLSLANKSFTIFGDVGSGIYPIYREKMTIFQALALTGDFNEASDRRHVRIIRTTDSGTKILNFDIRPKSIIESQYYYVYPNDIVYVRREFSSFYKVNSYNSLLSIITFSVSLLFNVLIYTK